MPDPLIEFFLAGPKHRVYYISAGGHQTLRDLADRLHATGPLAGAVLERPKVLPKKAAPSDWKKLTNTIQRTARNGKDMVGRNKSRLKCFKPPASQTKTRGETVEVCEFKADHHRAFFFAEDPASAEACTTLIVTHVYSDKKQDETPEVELKRFADLRTKYYDWRDATGAPDAVEAHRRTTPQTP